MNNQAYEEKLQNLETSHPVFMSFATTMGLISFGLLMLQWGL